MRVLFLSAWFPYPPGNGSKLRIYNLLRGLSAHHALTLVTYSETGEPAPAELNTLCEKVLVVPQKVYNPRSRRALIGFFNLKPRVLVDRHLPEMAACIRSELSAGAYDLVIASQWYTAAYLEQIPGVPAIFDEAEIGVFQDRVAHAGSALGQVRHRLTLLKMRVYFRRLLRRFSAVTVVSPQERELLQGLVPGYRDVEIMPNGVDLEDYAQVQAEPQPGRLIFTGSFTYRPNYEAMDWFARQVLPQIYAAVPEVQVHITGDQADLTLPGTGLIYHHGFVPDVRPEVAASWASLAPLQTGGGTRLKILEAMALGTPVIATSKGAEGLDALPGEHLLVADTPQDFARAAIRLLQDPALRRRLAANAGEFVRQRYDWQGILPAYLEMMERAAHSAAPGGRTRHSRRGV